MGIFDVKLVLKHTVQHAAKLAAEREQRATIVDIAKGSC